MCLGGPITCHYTRSMDKLSGLLIVILICCNLSVARVNDAPGKMCISHVCNNQPPDKPLITEREITVLDKAHDTMMRDYFRVMIDRQFAMRDSLLGTLRSAADWDMRAQVISDSLISWTGPLPEKTPLNARVTGKLIRDGYTVEKVLFESRPGFFVSGNLYLPENFPGRRPAHLNVIGHAKVGKADERYQRMSVSQVKKGFVVLTIDQLGQGERQVPLYEQWGSAPGNAHRIIGTQAFLSGTHVFNIMVWDAIRAVDFLVSLPQVDPEKICMTGSSGGGMMTTYILPFDGRIAVAVPTCNPNTWSHRVHANLATDHEQVFFAAFESGIDPRGDPLFCQAPRPLMLNTTSDDNLNPPRGVWELDTWLRKLYTFHGVPERFTTSMVRAAHDYNQEQREATYSWMLRWTGNDPSGFWEEETVPEKEEDLWAAVNGNVANEPGSRSSHEIVLDCLNENKAAFSEIKTKKDLSILQAKMPLLIRDVLNMNPADGSGAGVVKNIFSLGSYTIKQFIVTPEEGIVLPGIIIEQADKGQLKGTILYIHEKGKKMIMDDIYIVEALIEKGYAICAADLRGTGETAPDMSEKFWDFLAGKPLFGQRVADILSVIKWLKSENYGNNIKIWGNGMCSLYAAFSGVLAEGVSGMLLEDPLISFESVVTVDIPGYNHEILLPGILEKFDMPQIYQSFAPRPVMLANPLSGEGKTAGSEEISKYTGDVRETYRRMKSSGMWCVISPDKGERLKIITESPVF